MAGDLPGIAPAGHQGMGEHEGSRSHGAAASAAPCSCISNLGRFLCERGAKGRGKTQAGLAQAYDAGFAMRWDSKGACVAKNRDNPVQAIFASKNGLEIGEETMKTIKITEKTSLSIDEFEEQSGKTVCAGCGSSEKLGFDFDYAFQPIVDVTKRSIYAHEALVRGPGGESAMSVLSLVNESNRYRFDQSCRIKAIKGAAQLGMKEKISINFYPNAIYRPEVCIRTTIEAARVHGFPLEQIIFEVTEGEKVEDGAWLMNVLREYKSRGLMTAIDDFGAGYAGLSLLADFKPDLIKIDMGLVRGVDKDKQRQAVCRAIVSMCADMGVLVIAEGVETAGERDFFENAGVTLMQGYLFSKPAFKAIGKIDGQAWGANVSR